MLVVWNERRLLYTLQHTPVKQYNSDMLYLVARMSTDYLKGFAWDLDHDVEHRKQQGLRHDILNCVAVNVALVTTIEGPYRRQSLIKFSKLTSSQSERRGRAPRDAFSPFLARRDPYASIAFLSDAYRL